MSKWIDHLALWQFALFSFSALLVAVVIALIGIENLIGQVNVAWVVGYGAVFSAGQTIWAAWARQRRLQRLSSLEHVSVPQDATVCWPRLRSAERR